MQDKIYSKKISIFLLLMLFLSPKAVAYDVLITGRDGAIIDGYSASELGRPNRSPASRIMFLLQGTYALLSNRRAIASQTHHYWRQLNSGFISASTQAQATAGVIALELTGMIQDYSRGYTNLYNDDGLLLYPQTDGRLLPGDTSRSFEEFITQGEDPTCLTMGFLTCMNDSGWLLYNYLMDTVNGDIHLLARQLYEVSDGGRMGHLMSYMLRKNEQLGYENPTTVSSLAYRNNIFGYVDHAHYFAHQFQTLPSLVGIMVRIRRYWHIMHYSDRGGHAITLRGDLPAHRVFIVHDTNFEFLRFMPYDSFNYLYSEDIMLDVFFHMSTDPSSTHLDISHDSSIGSYEFNPEW